MSLRTPHTPLVPSADALSIIAAVDVVADRSFFAFVSACPDPESCSGAEWLRASVRFDDGVVSGSLGCTMPDDLAHELFAAFSGREPDEPLPPAHELHDLIGEFANMVCGAWLTRSLGERTFQLSPPEVTPVPRPVAPAAQRQWVKVNERPLVVEWTMTRGLAARGPQ